MTVVADAIRQGGIVLWPILAIAVLGGAVSLERLVYLFHRVAINGPVFMAQIQRAVLDGDIEEAVRFCSSAPEAVLPRVLKAGLVRAGRPESELRDALEEERGEVALRIRRRIGYLPMLAHVSILLGLVGTIQGLILSFQEAGTSAGPAALLSGSAVALHSACFGLMVSIPLLVAHGLVSARADAMLEELDHYALKLVNLLKGGRSRSGSQGGGAPILPFPG